MLQAAKNRVLLLLLLIVLFDDLLRPVTAWRRRRRRRAPPPCPYRCTASNGAINNNPYGLVSGGANVCTGTAYRSEMYCTPCHCGSCPAYRTQAYSILKCCHGYQQSGNTCPVKIPCNSAPFVPHSSYKPVQSSYSVGSKLTFTCDGHYSMSGSSVLTCVVGPSWTPAQPVCNPTPCTGPPVPPHAHVTPSQTSYPVGSSVRMLCNAGYRQTSGDATKVCQLGNRWTGAAIVCKPVCFDWIDSCQNGGVCTSPNFCSNCKDGFHSPRCDPCPKITNCKLSVCSHPDPAGSVTCRTCMYDYGPTKGRAYLPSRDGKTCLKQCSWRADSNVCYPGTCGVTESCKCAAGFTSPATQCRTIANPAKFGAGSLKLIYGSKMAGQTSSINITKVMEDEGIVYSNAEKIDKIDVENAATFLVQLPQSPPYIVRSTVGLEKYELELKLLHSSGTISLLTLNPSMQESSGLLKSIHQVTEKVEVASKISGQTLGQNDKFRFAVKTKNGGFVVVHNPENGAETKHLFTGQSSQQQMDIAIDRNRPRHCSMAGGCANIHEQPLQLNAGFSKNPNVVVTWKGWTDDLSQVGDSHLTVAEMTLGPDKLLTVGTGEHHHHFAKMVTGAAGTANIKLPTNRASVYEIKLVVCDRVIETLKNCQPVHRFILFDNGTSVTKTSEPLRVRDQVFKANLFWFTKADQPIQLKWLKHFTNAEFVRKGLLNAIKPETSVYDGTYEHNTGDRNISAVQNKLGITAFKVQVKKDSNKKLPQKPDPNAWITVGQDEEKTFPFEQLKYQDGDSLRFWVQAFDPAGNYLIDSQTLHMDSTPPFIGNFSLSDRPDVRVVGFKELFKIKFQLRIYDRHSGIFSVEWQLYDNFTRTNLVHGKSNHGNQRYADLAACKAAHSDNSCYETNMTGAFSDHFEIQLTKDGNLMPGMDVTQHDHDLQFNVKVVNNAGGVTESTYQISIDTTGPHPGVVMDGIQGQPEEDFRSAKDLKLAGHWSGFFDKESGIAFYKFKFGTSCFTGKHFSLSTKTDETTANSVTWTAPGSGFYHLTVVAYNNAMQPSVPVCSNGVRVVSAPPIVSMVTVDGLRSTKGLWLGPSDQLWLLREDRLRVRVKAASAACKSSAAPKDKSDLGLVPQLTIPHRPSPEVTLTDEECREIGAARNESSLAFNDLVNVSFVANDPNAGLRSTEVFLRGADGTDLAGQNTRGHSSAAFPTAPLQHGAQFHVVVRATSRADLIKEMSIGPITVNERPPGVTGKLNFTQEGNEVLVSWPATAVSDTVSPFPLIYRMSVENEAGAPLLMDKAQLAFNSKCPKPKANTKPTCSVVQFSKLGAISGKNYYFALHVISVIGHRAKLRSGAFLWPDPKPKDGILKFVDPAEPPLHVRTAKPIVAQANTTAMRIVWSGYHVTTNTATKAQLYVLDSEAKTKVAQREVAIREGAALFHSLKLINGKSYVCVFEITSSFGVSKSESRPVWIHPQNQAYADVSVKAGEPCGPSKPCSNVQASTSHLFLSWTLPGLLKDRAFRTKLSLSSRTAAGSWKFEAGTSLAASLQTNFTFTGLSLSPGRPYRVSVAFKIGTVTSAEHHSQNVWIAATPPLPQELTVTLPSLNKIALTFNKFLLMGYSVAQHDIYMKNYEWRISTSVGGTGWRNLSALTAKDNDLSATINLPANVSSVKCTTLVLRGISRSHLVASVERQVKACGTEPGAVRPGPVIDAKGPVELPDTFVWSKADIDYLKAGDQLTAVWPTLRYKNYQVAVLAFAGPDAPAYERTTLKLRNPCDDKRAVYCGSSSKRGINIPSNVALGVGKTYVLCIHANAMVVGTGNGREVLPDFSSCSDGVTVLPATAGKTGGVQMGPPFQSSANLLVVNWSDFFINAINFIPSHSIAKSYSFKIGTQPGSDNVVPSTNVGLANQAVVPRLKLSNGETYCATVEGVNVVEVNASASSPCVKIDLQAPKIISASNLRIDGSRHNFLNDVSILTLRWKGVFSDAESGICSYQWCVGTDPKFCDTAPAKITTATSVTTSLDGVFREGHSYYFNVRAVDCVGHSILLSSAPYTFIKSGPEVTKVLDGMENEDIDHQNSTSEIHAQWSPFVDRFSDVVEYFVRIGSIPCGNDVMSNFSVGLHLNVTLNHLMLRVGVRYYMCVTGCNAAGRCSSSVSDGFVIDDSAPTAGSVKHGANIGGNRQFQHSRRVIEFRLAGFADPESGLAAMEWSIGAASRDDVVGSVRAAFEPFVRARLTSDLPVGKLLFVYVSVWNNVGKKREAKSNGFIVDSTPPVFSERPSFDQLRHSLKPNTQIAVSSLSLKWRVADPDSGIAIYRIFVFAHGTAIEVAPPVVLRGFEISSYTLTKLKLRDGYRYKALVEACNPAGLCTKMDTESEILVDSTPAHIGMFKPRTNSSFVHEGDREMKWSGNDVILRYQGFSDPHSSVTDYVFTIGSSFFVYDLLPETRVAHDKSALVQKKTFKLSKPLKAGERIFIRLRAVNGVGLKSHTLHASFEAHADGHLDLVRRCKSDSCLGDCVCAPLHQTCAPTNDCKDETNKTGRPILSVSAKTTLTNPISAPAVTTTTEPCYLAASWTPTGGSFKRFEVSAGLSSLKDPSGIFDRVHERVWFDVGLDTWAVLNFTQRHGKCMKENTRYKFFVRAWHDAKSFGVFRSGDVTVLATAPQVLRLAGSRVREVDPSNADRDLNFVGDSVTSVRIVWPKQFHARLPGTISSYSIGLGTYCGAGNIVAFTSVSAELTEKVFSGLHLRHGHRLVASVRCCDVNGLCAEACSNGILADYTAPTTGLLLNTFSGLWNKCFQSNATHLSASWKEFADPETFVSGYEWCIGQSASDCSVQAWKPVGLHTHARTQLDVNHTHQSVFMRVRATNQVPNTFSQPVTGCGLVIDRTPPYLASGCSVMPDHVKNADFTHTTGAVMAFSTLKAGWWKGLTPVAPSEWHLTGSEAAAAVVTSSFSHSAGKFVLLKGGLSQTVRTVIGRPYVLVFHVADVGNWQGKAMRQGFVRVGSVVRLSFEVQARRREHRHIHWFKKLYFFQAVAAETLIQFGTLPSDVDGLGFDAVSLRQCQTSATGLNAIHAEIEQVGEFSRIHASFSPHDDESALAEVQWALGSVRGGVQFVNYRRAVSSTTFANTPLQRVPHGTDLHFSLLLINRAGLASLSHAPPLKVDHTPPTVTFTMSPTPCTDGCVVTSEKFKLSLLAHDAESNIHYCSYALGSHRSGTDLQDFKTVKPLPGRKDIISLIEFDTEAKNGRLIYPMVLCLNERGMATTKNVNSGYRIVTSPPTATHAQVSIVTPSTTFHSRTNPYQSQTDQIVFNWNGFFDTSGAEMTYEFALVGPKGSPYTEEWRKLPGSNVRLYILEGLRFEDGKAYDVKVRAVNSAKLTSKAVTTKVIIDSSPPVMTKDKIIVRRVSSEQFLVDWSAVFKDDSPMYYEVAIGSGQGKTDIFGFIETRQVSLTVKKASPLQTYHFVISAINSAGLYTQTLYKLKNFALAA